MNDQLNRKTSEMPAGEINRRRVRRGNPFIMLLAIVIGCTQASDLRAQFEVFPLSESVLDTDALVLATSGNFSFLINGSPFQQEVLLSHEGYQYAIWYHTAADQDIFIGRRDLNGNVWEIIDTGFNMEVGNQDWNSHNVISMGISGDGRIHLAFDHHVDPLRYVTTNTGVATSAGGPWNSSIFNAERRSLNPGGPNIPRITYPRFTNVGDDLVFTYRDFGSGNGDHRSAHYNSQTGQWSGTRFLTRGRSTGQVYDDVNNNPSNGRNSYHNGFHADPFGRLHTTWTWRERTQDGNHDIMYAYSDDNGATWRNTNNQQVGTNSSPITLNSNVEVVNLDRRQAVLNQQGQVVDADGGVHALMFHRPVGPTYNDSPFSDTSGSDYHHYYRNPVTGIWETNVFPGNIAVGSRPRLGVDSSGNLYGLYVQNRDLVIAGSQKINGEYADWQILYRDNSRDYAGTPQLDLKRLFNDGVLSVYIQDRATSTSPNNPTGVALRVLEFQTVVPEPASLFGSLVAGWDTWTDASNPIASITAVGVTGNAVTTSEGTSWNVTDGRGASADGDWGTFAGPPAASTVAGDGVTNENLELSNATTGGTITFTLTNNGPSDIDLDGFHFDAYAFRNKAARAYELSVVSGDLTNAVIYTSTDDEITTVNGAWDNNAHDDISHGLTDLPDHTLEAGGTVSFLLAFSSGAGDGSGGHDLWVDNVAITGTSALVSQAPDGSLRFNKSTGVVDGQGIGFILNSDGLEIGQTGTAPFDRAAVMVFQLPNLGAVEAPFQTAAFQAYLTQTVTSGNVGGDLYGIARRAAPEILNTDYYGLTNTPDSNADLLEDDFLVEGMPINQSASTSETGDANLLDFLNAQYAGGAGAGEYVFLRLNVDADTSQRWKIASGDAASEEQKPQIRFTAVSGPAFRLGDFNGDGFVNLSDLDQYNGNIDASAVGPLEALDLDGDGIVGANDFRQHYETLVETSNGQVGTFAGDLNLDGTVNVLGDAFALVSNLGNSAISWGQGDFNADGVVNVLGDAFALVANLGQSNE